MNEERQKELKQAVLKLDDAVAEVVAIQLGVLGNMIEKRRLEPPFKVRQEPAGSFAVVLDEDDRMEVQFRGLSQEEAMKECLRQNEQAILNQIEELEDNLRKYKKLFEESRSLDFKKTDNIFGTHLQGYVNVDFNELVSAFGPPHFRFDDKELPSADKCAAEWFFSTHYDCEIVVFTLYDYQYRDTGKIPEGLYQWHIGGQSRKAVEVVRQILLQHRELHGSDEQPEVTFKN